MSCDHVFCSVSGPTTLRRATAHHYTFVYAKTISTNSSDTHATSLCLLTVFVSLQLFASASPRTIYIDDDDDFQSDCLDEVEPGDTCYLEEGNY